MGNLKQELEEEQNVTQTVLKDKENARREDTLDNADMESSINAEHSEANDITKLRYNKQCIKEKIMPAADENISTTKTRMNERNAILCVNANKLGNPKDLKCTECDKTWKVSSLPKTKELVRCQVRLHFKEQLSLEQERFFINNDCNVCNKTIGNSRKMRRHLIGTHNVLKAEIDKYVDRILSRNNSIDKLQYIPNNDKDGGSANEIATLLIYADSFKHVSKKSAECGNVPIIMDKEKLKTWTRENYEY